MNSIVQVREEVLDFGREQQHTRTELVIGIVCGDCSITGDEPRDPLTDSDQIPEINSTHLPELESLVEFMQKMGDRLWSRLRIPPDVFVSGLKRLTDALLKQRRHLRNILPKPGAAKFELIIQRETCHVCHRPMKDLDPGDDCNAFSSVQNRPK